jgi:hypothetical protein
MNRYADTGFICSLYAPDAHTERACKFMEKLGDPANKTLANWVWTQRGLARKNKLHPEKRHLLNKLGFDWNPKNTRRA